MPRLVELLDHPTRLIEVLVDDTLGATPEFVTDPGHSALRSGAATWWRCTARHHLSGLPDASDTHVGRRAGGCVRDGRPCHHHGEPSMGLHVQCNRLRPGGSRPRCAHDTTRPAPPR